MGDLNSYRFILLTKQQVCCGCLSMPHEHTNNKLAALWISPRHCNDSLLAAKTHFKSPPGVKPCMSYGGLIEG